LFETTNLSHHRDKPDGVVSLPILAASTTADPATFDAALGRFKLEVSGVWCLVSGSRPEF